jgi:hypothetical protein
VRSILTQQARLDQQLTVIVRRVHDRGDWIDAGCTSTAQWLAQISTSDYRAAERITRTSDALRELPALDEAMSNGELSLDQAVAVVEVATPETDEALVRIAVGKAPGQITRAARMLVPPTLVDDTELYRRRALRMTWSGDKRELRFSGSLPLEQGAAFEQAIWSIAKPLRAADKKAGNPVLEWSQYTADALVTLASQPGSDNAGGVRRSPTTLIVHLSDDGTPPLLEGTGPISIETAERLACDARRLTIKRSGSDLVHSRVTRCASYAQLRALHKRSGHCQYPGCTATANSKPTTSSPTSTAARRSSTTSSCSAPATTNCSTTTTSPPAAPATTPPSPTDQAARSPPTNHTHHHADTNAVSARPSSTAGR